MNHLVICLILALWIPLIAVFSIQNITPVSLQFLTFESIRFPVGVLLSFCGAGGMVIGAIAPGLWGLGKSGGKPKDRDILDEFEF